MKAMAVRSYGPIDKLEVIELPEPVPSADQVIVRVRSSAVNPADSKVITGKVKMLHGRNFPLVVGYDFAGEIEKVGEKVVDLKIGDRVFGHLPYSGKNRQGTFSEKIAVAASSIAKIPKALSFEQAGACATGSLTALQALRKALEDSPGKYVLVNGASGGVGVFAVQIAKIYRADVTATCSKSSMDFVKKLGADRVVDYKSTEPLSEKYPRKFNVIFDVASNLSFFEMRAFLEPKGTFVTLLPSLSVFGGILLRPFISHKSAFVIVKSVDKNLNAIAQWADAGKLTVPIEKSYAFKDVAGAIRQLDGGGVKGKIAVQIDKM